VIFPIHMEVYSAGTLLESHVVPNMHVARVYIARQEAKGLHVLVFRPRTESERAA